MAPKSLQEAQALWERYSEIPTIAAAEVLADESAPTVKLDLTYTDHALLTKSTAVRHLPLPQTGGTGDARGVGGDIAPLPVEPAVKAEVAFEDHDSSNGRIILRESSGDKKRRFVDIWNRTSRQHSVEVTDVHGAFSTDATFGGLSARFDSGPNGGVLHILYEAAGKAEWEQKQKDADPQDPLLRFQYQSPSGEKFAKDFQPQLFHISIAAQSRISIEQVQSQVAGRLFAQGVLAGNSIAAVGYDTVAGERRLGQVYCTNRPSGVYLIPLNSRDQDANADCQAVTAVQSRVKLTKATMRSLPEAEAVRISSQDRAARSPRITPSLDDKSSLIWLETPLGGAHNTSSAIMRLDMHSTEAPKPTDAKEIISLDWPWIVESGESKKHGSGLFVDNLPKQPFFRASRDGPVLFGLTTIAGSQRLVRAFDLDGTPAQEQEACLAQDPDASYAFLAGDLNRGGYLAQRSAPSSPPCLLWATRGSQAACLWRGPQPDSLEVAAQVYDIAATKNSQSGSDDVVEAIFARPAKTTKPPCILLPHGGPHGTTTLDWAPGLAVWLACGYSVLAPNFHGSLGRSRKFVDSLIGRAGTLDIDDCIKTVDWAVSQGHVDPSQVYLSGGSHGGFILGHLSGRYPQRWKAVAMRNPVTHIGEQFVGTDIRDWCCAELGLPFDFSRPPAYLDPVLYAAMDKVSPLQYYRDVTAPILILLGNADQRVPPLQGIALYHALKAEAKAKVAACIFDGADHALDTVEAARGSWVAQWKWFEEARLGRTVE